MPYLAVVAVPGRFRKTQTLNEHFASLVDHRNGFEVHREIGMPPVCNPSSAKITNHS